MQRTSQDAGTKPEAGSTAAGYFGWMVERYDSLIRRAVPRYDEMITRLVEHLPELGVGVRILELGCGTGNLTLRLLEKYAGAVVTAVDAAPEMTQVTAERAGTAGQRARLAVVTDRFEKLAFEDGSFDLVASSLSLHHVRDKAPLYAAVARWLRPGGRLVFADQFLGASEAVTQVHWDLWLAFCREPGHCTEEEIAGLTEHARVHDHYEALTSHFAMMERAGFVELDLMWRNGMYCVMGGTRRGK